MKLLVPLVIITLIILGALAFWKLGMSSNNSALQSVSKTSSVTDADVSKQAPITGNPEDVDSTINQAAQDEAGVVNSNDESTVVNQNNAAAGAVGEAYNENSF